MNTPLPRAADGDSPVSATPPVQMPTVVAVAAGAPAKQWLTTASRPMSLQARLDRSMARALPMVRYQLSRLGIIAALGIGALVIAAAAAVFLLLPAHQTVVALHQKLATVSQPIPVTGQVDQTPQRFASTLPSRAQVPALLGTVMAQAASAGVTLDKGTYIYSPASGNRLAHYLFEFPVKADYASVRAFIDKSLIAVPALGLERLHVERKNVADTLIQADVGFVIYLRGS